MTIIAIVIGIEKPKADTINYNYKQYRIQYYSLSQGTSAWNSWTNFGTSSPLSNGYGVSTLAVRFGYSTKFSNGTSYRVIIESGFSPQETINQTFLNVGNTTCAGSSTSTWSADTSLISSCTYIGAYRVSGTNHVKYVFDITPNANIYGFQFNIQVVGTSEVSSVNTYTKSTITSGADIEGAIEEQTIIIQDGINDIQITIENSIQDLIDNTHDYTGEDELEDTNDIIDDMYELEDDLNELIGIQPWQLHIPTVSGSYNFIWTIVEIFRKGIIIDIITAVLVIGVIKMVLNR